MITYSQLGFNGRLGNQLFQLASTIGYALDNNQRYVFNWGYSNHFHLERVGGISPTYSITEQHGLNYDNLPEYRPEMGCVDLKGYLQSHLYFDHHRDVILKHFKTNETINDFGFIHVRRGDYLNLPDHHPIQPVEYYIKGMNILGKSKYLCFSDDIEWCERNIIDDRIVFVKGVNEIDTLKMMMECNAAVIANSSFSWWGAYLGNHDNVVAPANWFGPAYQGFKISDRIPERWIVC